MRQVTGTTWIITGSSYTKDVDATVRLVTCLQPTGSNKRELTKADNVFKKHTYTHTLTHTHACTRTHTHTYTHARTHTHDYESAPCDDNCNVDPVTTQEVVTAVKRYPAMFSIISELIKISVIEWLTHIMNIVCVKEVIIDNWRDKILLFRGKTREQGTIQQPPHFFSYLLRHNTPWPH